MAISFLPGNPGTGTPDSFFMKAWFKRVADFCKGAFGVANVQTADFTCTDQEFYPCDTSSGNITATLPVAASQNGKPFTFKKTAAANTLAVTINNAAPSDTIEGGTSYSLTAVGNTVTFVSDGVSTWYIHSVGGTSGFLASPLTTKGDLWGYSTVNARVPIGATNGHVLTVDSTQALGLKWAAVSAGTPGGADTQIQYNDAGAFGGEAAFTYNKTTNTLTVDNAVVAADLTMSKAGGRFYVNTTNATLANRTIIQETAANSATALGIMPSGSGTVAQLNVYGGSDPDNTHRMAVRAIATAVGLNSTSTGTGTTQPITLAIAGVPALTIATTGNATLAGDTSFTGDIVKIRNQTTTFPAANAVGMLTNNGSGTLTWTPAGASTTVGITLGQAYALGQGLAGP